MSFVFAGQYGPQMLLGVNSGNVARALPSQSVNVYTIGTTTPITLYTDRTKGTTQAQPIAADGNGNLTFFADPGRYDVVFTPSGGVQVRVTVEVGLDTQEVSAAYVPYRTNHSTDIPSASSILTPFNGAAVLVGVEGNQGPAAFVSYNNLAAGTTAFPTAISTLGRVDNNNTAVFGAYITGESHNPGGGGACAAEIDAFNYGAASVITYPPDRSGTTTQNVTTGVLIGAGGTAHSAIGLQIAQEGSSPQKFVCGIYIDPAAIQDYPLHIGGGGAFPTFIGGNVTYRSLANTAASFGVDPADGALGAHVLLGSENGNSPFIAASMSQGAATPLLFIVNNAEAMRVTNTGNVTFQGSALVNCSSSTNAAPGVIGLNNLNGTGNAARVQVGDVSAGFQNAFGDKAQIYSYGGLEIRGGRANLSAPAFVANSPTPAATAIINEQSGSVAFAVNGASGQSVDLADYLVNGTLLAAITKDGAVRTGNGTTVGGALFSGSGAPASALGANGDFYHRTDTLGTANQRIYVKSAGTWTGIL